MTDQTDRPAIDIEKVAWNALSIAQAAAERGEQKLAETESLLSIAASLRQVCLQNDAALDCHDQHIALNAKSLELTERLVAIAESSRPLEMPAELVADGCCCRQEANSADDMLEYAFGLICNADNSISSGGHLKDEWEQASKRFITGYNERMSHRFGGSLEQQLIRLRADLADMQAARAAAAELDARSQT